MRAYFLFLALACAACGDDTLQQDIASQPQAPRPAENATCSDPRYNDTRCDYVPLCGAPDPDCFARFDTPQGAVERLDGDLAVIDAASPVAQRAQRLFDQAWSLWRQHGPFPLYALAQERPLLVVIDSTDINAFATEGGAQRTAFAVYVYSGLLNAFDDEAIIGVFAHELSHMLRLQPNGNAEPLLEPYFAAADVEPFGGLVSARTRLSALEQEAFMERMTFQATYGTELTNANYDALPLEFETLMSLSLSLPEEGAECANRFKAYVTAASPIIGALYSGVAENPNALHGAKIAFDALSTCLPPESVERLRKGRIDAKARHAALSTALQRDLNLMRYYSEEELADDDAAMVLRGGNLSAVPMGRLVIAPEYTAACETMLRENRVPPYGLLQDPHHSGCYRWFHQRAIEDQYVTITRPLQLKATRRDQLVRENADRVPVPDGGWRPAGRTSR